MKKILQLCLMALVAAILVVAFGAGINSCSEGGLGQFIKGPGFSEMADTVSAQPELSYELTSPVDAVAYQITRQREVAEDSVFRSMDPQVVSMVTQVLLKTKPVINVSDIVQEYQSQSQISYDKLAKENKSDDPLTKPKASIELVQEGTTTVTEAQPTRVDKTTTTTRDTTIDGKQATIVTTIHELIMGKVAIVITYDGTEPSDTIKSRICNALTQSGYCNCQKEVCVYFVNEKELVQAIATKPVQDVVNEHFYKSERLTEQELAVTYIAGICKDSINKSVSHFAADFAVKFCDALRKGNNPQLLEAVKILTRDYAMSRVSDKIQRETGFNDEIYRIVLNISSDMWNVLNLS